MATESDGCATAASAAARERAERDRVDVDREDDELVAPRAGHQVAFCAEVVDEPARDGAQQFVADLVAEGVVDAAESVEVDGADADRAAPGSSSASWSRSASTARVARPVRVSWSAWKRRGTEAEAFGDVLTRQIT